ncbi:MAG: hypothetical protein ACFFD2_09435 [Promethearchaeota archaeon]
MVKLIQSKDLNPPKVDFPILFYATLLFFFGINHILSFLRPVSNLYIIYYELNWAEFQFLECFDIINIIFGILIILLAGCLFFYKEFNRSLVILGSIAFFLYNIINPSHFLIFGSLLSIIIGNPPAWMSVIPDNLLGIYLFSWGIISISNILLQLIGLYIALRIVMKLNPKRALIQFLFFYCWVLGVSGIILCLQSIVVLSLTASWSSITIFTYILLLGTWILMSIVGIFGVLFTQNWLKNQIERHHILCYDATFCKL